jgi:hypothetical protein
MTEISNQIYSRYLVVFMDILGIKEMVRISEDNLEYQKKLSAIFNRIEEIELQLKNQDPKLPFPTISRISDSIILSHKEPDLEIFTATLTLAAIFQFEIIREGAFFRGAALIERLNQLSNSEFGPALVKANEVESKMANWPRIIVDSAILDSDLSLPTDVLRKHFMKTAMTLDGFNLNNINFINKRFNSQISTIRDTLKTNIRAQFHKEYFSRSSDGLEYVI